MALVTKDNIDLEKVGYGLYHTNETMRDISNIMEHPEFNSFFQKYFSNPIDTVTMLQILKFQDFCFLGKF